MSEFKITLPFNLIYIFLEKTKCRFYNLARFTDYVCSYSISYDNETWWRNNTLNIILGLYPRMRRYVEILDCIINIRIDKHRNVCRPSYFGLTTFTVLIGSLNQPSNSRQKSKQVRW